MGLPLGLSLQEDGLHRPRRGSRGQGTVIGDPKVVTKPNQLRSGHGVSYAVTLGKARG
jgi:hypothetical protein